LSQNLIKIGNRVGLKIILKVVTFSVIVTSFYLLSDTLARHLLMWHVYHGSKVLGNKSEKCLHSSCVNLRSHLRQGDERNLPSSSRPTKDSIIRGKTTLPGFSIDVAGI
jgi:hypothetical protein